MARTITFQPNPKMELFIEGLINSGDFNNQSEVIRAAIRLLEEKTASSKIQQLRTLIEEGEQSPDIKNFSMSAIHKRLDER